jgi:hypothetical protein
MIVAQAGEDSYAQPDGFPGIAIDGEHRRQYAIYMMNRLGLIPSFSSNATYPPLSGQSRAIAVTPFAQKIIYC